MVKIVYKRNPNMQSEFQSLNDLYKACRAIAVIKNQSILGYVLGNYRLYIDGIEYTC